MTTPSDPLFRGPGTANAKPPAKPPEAPHPQADPLDGTTPITQPPPAESPRRELATIVEPEPRALVPITNGRITPQEMGGLWRLAKLVHASQIVPKGAKTVESVFVALAAGAEVGLSPMQAIAYVMVVNGRPCLWGDAAIGVVEASGKLEDISETIEGTGEDRVAVCKIARRNRPTPVVSRFSVADARRAQLWNKAGPWTQYPDRMLAMRARGFGLRNAFADVLLGLGIAEEQTDIESHEAERDMNSRLSTVADPQQNGST